MAVRTGDQVEVDERRSPVSFLVAVRGIAPPSLGALEQFLGQIEEEVEGIARLGQGNPTGDCQAPVDDPAIVEEASHAGLSLGNLRPGSFLE